MQISDYLSPKQTIPHPKCPDCGGEMWLARIEPDQPDHDTRTFECQRCLKSITTVVKYK